MNGIRKPDGPRTSVPGAWVLTAGLLASLTLAGCGASQAGSAAGTSASAAAQASSAPASAVSAKPSGLTKFVLSYSSVSYSQNAILVAKEAGLMAQNGIDLQLVFGPNGIPAQIAGDVQGSVTSTEEVVSAVAGGADLAIVATFLPYMQQDFLVRPEIKTMADLKGKPVGVTRRGTITETVVRMAAQRGGIDADKDLQILELGTSDKQVAAMTAGSIFGSGFSSPNSDVAIKQGAHTLYAFSKEQIPYPAADLIVTRSWAQKNEPVLLGVLKALAQSTVIFQTKPDYVAQVYEQYAKSGADAAKQAAENAKANIPVKMLPTAEGIKAVQDVVAVQNPNAAKVPVTKFFDDSYIKKLDAQGFYATLGA